ncbi:MAG: hypothetical protein ABFD50_19265 [Smithella sp.]
METRREKKRTILTKPKNQWFILKNKIINGVKKSVKLKKKS